MKKIEHLQDQHYLQLWNILKKPSVVQQMFCHRFSSHFGPCSLSFGNQPNPLRQRWSIEALRRTYWAIIVHCMAVHVQGNGSKHYFSLIRFWLRAWCLLRGGHPKKSKWGMFLWGVSMVGKVCYRYPPTNIYIPPGKQETHLQKCLGRGILVPGRVWEKKTACKTCPFLSGE